MSFFDDIGKTLNTAFTDVSKALYGYDPSKGKWNMQGSLANQGKDKELAWAGYNSSTGKWGGNDSAPGWLDEGFGELTGRNQSRASLNFAKQQYDTANQQAQALIAQQQWNRQNSDVMASNQAAASTKTASMLSGANYSNSTPLGVGSPGALAPQKDFLGL